MNLTDNLAIVPRIADVATVDVYHIQSSHNSVLAEPDVVEIARHVRDYLISI